jgi:hypothetical protein
MNLRVRENRWRLMLAVNLAVLIGVFLYKITREPYVPYIHLLVDYHFGFTKRALIGALVAVFFAKVPVWLVFALSATVWHITLGLFIQLFRRTFGFDDENTPVFVFMAGSPFFLKNFMYTLGHFDIYGCAVAISLLLMPARSVAFVILAALGSMILVLIHHIHLLMYVPTIAVIVVLRYYLGQGFTRQNMLIGIAAIVALGSLFLAAQLWGSIAIPEAEFVTYLHSRMADPTRASLLSFSYIWYQPLSHEIQDTWERMPSNILGIPVFALLIWMHAPLWTYFEDLIGSLSDKLHRRDHDGEPGLSHHFRDRVRLFAMDLELGSLHVPDPACSTALAQRKGGSACLVRYSQRQGVRMDPHADPAGWNCETILKHYRF